MYLRAIEVRALVLAGCLILSELDEQQAMISICQAGEFALVVELLGKNLPLLIK